MAYMKKHCSGCCTGCNNGYAQVSHANNSCNRSGCSSCGHHHGCGCNHHHGCSSCGCGNSFGTLRSVTGPFSNCGNWWSGDNFPYYTGPCGPCDPCEQCCCREWPWPWPPIPPVVPVNGSYAYSGRNSCNTDCDTGCPDDCAHNHCASGTGYTSHKNCYRTTDSCNDACAARQVKPIVDCSGCRHRCDCDD